MLKTIQKLSSLIQMLGVVAFIFAYEPVRADILQHGCGYNNMNNAPVTITYSFSGSFPDGGEIWLLPVELEVPAGARRQINPPQGFTPTDFVIISQILRGRDCGGYTVDDPPGASLILQVDLPCVADSTDPTRLYGYLLSGGGQDFGPVTATIPIVKNGFESNGVPRLFAAEVDLVTGLPVLSNDPGHCFIPTSTPINNPETGEILPGFVYVGETTVCATLEFGQPIIPTLTEWGLIIFGVVLLGFITWVFLRRRKVAAT